MRIKFCCKEITTGKMTRIAGGARASSNILTRAQSSQRILGRRTAALKSNTQPTGKGNGSGKGQPKEKGPKSSSSKGPAGKGVEVTATQEDTRVDEEAPSTVYLEPIDLEKEIPKHPVEVGKWLHQSGFTRFQEITKIGKFRYKIDLEAKQDYEELKKVDLAEQNLKFYTPKLQNQTICFVPGVPQSFGDADLETDIRAEVPVIKVERLKRRDKSQKLVDTNNLKVTVQGREVPRLIKIYGVAFRAHLYIFPVKQCVQCWKFGHTKVKCHGRVLCRKCGQAHETGEDECQQSPHCINCGKEHESNSRECSERIRRINILGRMREKRIPFGEAEKEFPRNQNRFSLLAEEQCFPDFSDTDTSIGSRTGAVPKRNPTWRQRQQNYNEGQGIPIERERRNPRPREGSETSGPVITGNPHKATDFEAFIAELRREFIRFCNAKEWLKPLVELRDKLRSKILQQRTEIETDALLIEVSTNIENILNAELGIENQIQNNLSSIPNHGI